MNEPANVTALREWVDTETNYKPEWSGSLQPIKIIDLNTATYLLQEIDRLRKENDRLVKENEEMI